MRPDNLGLELDSDVRDRVRIVRAHDDHPAELAGQLWDLPSWAGTGQRLLDHMEDATDVPSSPCRPATSAAALISRARRSACRSSKLWPE